MSVVEKKSKSFLFVLTVVAATLVSSCSDDAENTSKSTAKQSASSVKEASAPVSTVSSKARDAQYYQEESQPLDKATWVEKGKFRGEFANNCVLREKTAAKNASSAFDKELVTKACECIADYMDDKLTEDEADEYLRDDNNSRSLQIRFDAAAYHCLQEPNQSQHPKITHFN